MVAIRRPQCSENDDAMALDVRIGYYGPRGAARGSDDYLPENIPAGALTHINLAFEYVSEDHEITDTQGQGLAAQEGISRSTGEYTASNKKRDQEV
ncbi:hypothetical protein BDW68DRAFT_176286 [Aspergillus falconensis]